ncbi:phosphoribosylglycinamide formyltransferase [soil metagenome]
MKELCFMQTTSMIILISGNGSNLQAIIDAIAAGKITAKIAAVISNRSNAFGLVRAQNAGIPTHVLESKNFANRSAFDAALQQLIDSYQPDLVILAGFMHILASELVQTYNGRMLNIHPSLLPKYRGLHTHIQALQAKDAEHGTTVHFVTEELDGGPIIAQASLTIKDDDTVESLQTRLQQLEHQLYPAVIQWFVSGRLLLQADGVWLDGERVAANGRVILSLRTLKQSSRWLNRSKNSN